MREILHSVTFNSDLMNDIHDSKLNIFGFSTVDSPFTVGGYQGPFLLIFLYFIDKSLH